MHENTFGKKKTTVTMGKYQLKRPRFGELIGSETLLVPERWLFRWTGEPPYEFCLFKVLFQTSTPADIVHNGWQVLEPAVSELAKNLNLRTVSTKIDWLKLNQVSGGSCQIGVNHNEETVVAATSGNDPNHFIPFRFFETLSGNAQWLDLEYTCSHRHFIARFQTGSTFYTERHSLSCDLEHALHFGVHGVHSLRTIIRVGETPVMLPYWFRVSGTLWDLPGKVDRMARMSETFIGKLGRSWLPYQDITDRSSYVASLLRTVSVPDYMRNELRRDTGLTRCMTKLDLLLYLSAKFKSDSMIPPSDMYKLSKTLFFQR